MKYQVKTNKKTINSKDIIGEYKDISIDEDGISYYSNYINENDIYEKNDKKVISFIKKHLISLLSLLIILLFLFNLNYCFIKIDIRSDNISKEEKEELLNDFNEYYNSFFVFKYLKNDIEEINNQLKSKYYQYEWLNVYKKGINLIIELKPKDNYNIKEEDDKVGDLIAKEAGIIYSSYIQKGVLLVKQNYYVNKGDILVSGNLKYNINQEEYVKASGYVIACVFDIVNIEIEKVETNIIRSGRIEIINQYKFMNKDIESDFEMYETEIIEGKYFFSKDKIIVYELTETLNNYTYDEALNYSKSKIINDFNQNVVHNDEKILDIFLLKNSEDKTKFYFTYLVKSYKNIAEFKEYINN